jgi:hypothetical protein
MAAVSIYQEEEEEEEQRGSYFGASARGVSQLPINY